MQEATKGEQLEKWLRDVLKEKYKADILNTMVRHAVTSVQDLHELISYRSSWDELDLPLLVKGRLETGLSSFFALMLTFIILYLLQHF